MPDEPSRPDDEARGEEVAGGEVPEATPPGDEGDGDDALEARLHEIRERILEVDEALIRLVGERRALVLEVGEVKEALGRPVLDPAREAQVVRRAAELSRELGVDEELTRDVIWRIVASAREAQEGTKGWGPVEPPPETPEEP